MFASNTRTHTLLKSGFLALAVGCTLAMVQPAKAIVGPLSPESVTVNATDETTADITWAPAADGGETKYLIQKTSQFGTKLVTEVDKDITSYHITDLYPNTGYTFSVAGKDALDVVSAYTDSAYVFTHASIPTNLTASVISDTEVKISWEGNGTYSKVINVTTGEDYGWKAAAKEFLVQGLTCNQNYDFKVVAVNGDNTHITDPSAPLTINTGVCTHFKPTNVHVENVATSSLDVVWTPDANGAEDTFVVQKTTQFGTKIIAELPRASTTLHVEGLDANTQYTFGVAAKDNLGMSGYVTTDANTLANTPSNVTVTAVGDDQLAFSWDADGTYSIIENSTENTNSGWVVYAKSYRFYNLSCGKTYEFKVKSQNSSNIETAYSATITASTNPCGVTPVSGGPLFSPSVLGEKISGSTSTEPTMSTTTTEVTTSIDTTVNEPAESRLDQLIRETKFLDRSDAVKELQTELRNRGFFPRWVRSTGFYWVITRGAVAKYLASK